MLLYYLIFLWSNLDLVMSYEFCSWCVIFITNSFLVSLVLHEECLYYETSQKLQLGTELNGKYLPLIVHIHAV